MASSLPTSGGTPVSGHPASGTSASAPRSSEGRDSINPADATPEAWQVRSQRQGDTEVVTIHPGAQGGPPITATLSTRAVHLTSQSTDPEGWQHTLPDHTAELQTLLTRQGFEGAVSIHGPQTAAAANTPGNAHAESQGRAGTLGGSAFGGTARGGAGGQGFSSGPSEPASGGAPSEGSSARPGDPEAAPGASESHGSSFSDVEEHISWEA